MTLRIGTRGSRLALAQASWVAQRLPDAELVTIASEGDRSSAPLAEIGGQGVFAGTLRRALRAGEVDVLVHSLKDLPAQPAEGIELTVPTRADARDALCVREALRTPAPGKVRGTTAVGGRNAGDPARSRGQQLLSPASALDALPAGSRVGTGSPRRQAQLRAHRPDLEVVDIRGNVDTRLGRLETEDPSRALDALVLAAAGLERTNHLEPIAELLGLTDWPTAPGQGALGLETRTGERRHVVNLEHRPSRLAVDAERGVLAALEAGCTAPIGAHALLEDGLLFLSARVYAPDGSTWVTASHALYPEDAVDPAHEVAVRVAEELVAQGAMELA